MRSFFASPPQSAAKARRDRLETAKQEEEEEQTRRRTFAFLKHSDRRTSTSMNKSREHAKQLAMVFSQDEPELRSPLSTSSAGFTADFDAFQQTVSVTKQARSSSMLDSHLAQDREATASTVASLQDSFETASVGSAYDMEFLGNSNSAFPTSTPSRNKKNRAKSTNTLDQFVERQQSPHFQDFNVQRIGGSLVMRQKSSNSSQSSWPAQEQERSVISMPTIPSNSSMQSTFARQNSSGSEAQSSSTTGSGAAARRRMRNQIRQSSNSSVASGNEDADSYCSTPPESPASAKQISSAAKNRLTAYQSSGPKIVSGSSFYSQSSANSQHSSDNLFDSENDGGFTFDAFGLDQSQVEREVNEAMQELAGQGMPGFSMFLDPNNDEFAPQNWDNSPAGSRQSTPTPSEDGFVDGFRVTRQASVRESPPSSTSSQNNDGRVNLFKQQAGFGSSAPQNRYPRSSAANIHTPPKSCQTPPRWENASPNRDTRKTVPAAPMPLMDEPINPWTQDPWSSDPENNSQSDVGTSSDIGGTKSDIVTSAQYKSNARWTQSSAKSDIDMSNNKSVSFSANLVASQSPQEDSSDDGAEAQMQEELAQEFAKEFVSKLSPRHEQAQYQSPNQDGPQGYGHSDQYQQQDYGHANQYEQQDDGHSNQYEQQGRAHSDEYEQQPYEQSYGAHAGESGAQSDGSAGYGNAQSPYNARADVGGRFGQDGPDYGRPRHAMDQGATHEQSHYGVDQVDEYGHPHYGPDQVADIGHEQYAPGQESNYGHAQYAPGQEADYGHPQYGPGQDGDYQHAQYSPGQGVDYGQSRYSDHGTEYSQSPHGAQFDHGAASGYGQQAHSPDGAQSDHDDASDFGNIKSPYADHFEYAQRSSDCGDHQKDYGETSDYVQAQSGYGPSHPAHDPEPDNTPSGYHMRVAQGSTSPTKSTGGALQKDSSDNKFSVRSAYGAATAGYRGSEYDVSSKNPSSASSTAGASSHYGEAPDIGPPKSPSSIKNVGVAAKRSQFNSITMTAAEKYAQQTSPFLPKPAGVISKKWGSPASCNVPKQNPVPASNWKKEASMDAPKSPASASFQRSEYAGDADTNAGAHYDYGPPSDVGVNSEVGTHSDYGPRSDVGVNSDVQFGSEMGGDIPTEVTPKAKKSDQKSPGEEKKDDDRPSEVKKVSNLKAKWKHWEAKSTSKSTPFENKTPASQPKQKDQSQATKNNIATLQTSLGDEFLTPVIIEARRQEARRLRQEELKRSSIECGAVPSSPTKLSQENLRKASSDAVSITQAQRLNECNDQRTSFASFRERLRPAPHSKSEGGAALRTSSVNQVLDRLQNKSPRGALTSDVNSPSTYLDTQSDVGSFPSFLAGVQLLKTPSSKLLLAGDEAENMESGKDYLSPREGSGRRSLSYRERACDHRAEDNEDPFQDNEPEEMQFQKPPIEKKLTYRERRELELKLEEAEKARQEASKAKKKQPQRDVASLIRRRIAANKQKDEQAVSSGESTNFPEPVSQYRTLLKPVKIEGSAQKESLSNQRPSYDTDTMDQAYPASPDHISPEKGSSTPLSTEDQKRNFGSHPTSSSPRRFDQDGPTRLDNVLEQSTHDELSGDTALYDMVSPSSAGTEMDYSTDTSHMNGDGLGSPRESTQVYRSPREMTQDYRSPIGANQGYRSPRELVQDGNANKHPSTKLQIDSNRFERFMDDKKSGSAETSSIRSQETPATADTSQTGGSKDPGDEEPTDAAGVKAMLSSFLGGKGLAMSALPAPSNEDDAGALMRNKRQLEVRHNPPVETITTSISREAQEDAPPPALGSPTSSGRPALKDDPKFERYFRMLKVGMPIDVVKHAMKKDGADPSVMDGDHDKPVGLPLKEDPRYTKYFKMLKMGISIEQVKHAMERDGLAPEIMDQDHTLPADPNSSQKTDEPKEKATHRRARLHWNTLQKVRSNSLWAKIEKDPEIIQIDIDEEEFNELFQADLMPAISPRGLGANRKRGAAVRVIDAKRANNGGIILARLKMTHDDMADAVDRIDGDALTAEQIEHIIEFLPTKEERNQLEKYMLTGGQDAAEKFDGLCECEKFMVAMMTVKHAKRKVRALLFKLQFMSCLESIAEDTTAVETSCNELSNSTRLRQLLGIVLQFGNRLNTAGVHSKRKAGAFTLDSLLKLNQAKAFDKKTTFLHYVVLIVQRNNELLLRFKDDLPTVLKADKVYWDQCLADLEEVENQLENVRRISLHQARMAQQCRLKKSKPQDDDDNDSLGGVSLSLEEEVESLRATSIGLFTLGAIKQVSALRDKVEVTKSKFHRLLEYFGEEDKKWQPHDLFNVITTFCRDFEKAKEEVYSSIKKKQREERKKSRTNTPNSGKPPAGPDRTSMPLRASNLQPNMSKVIKDMQPSPNPTNSREPTRKLQKMVGEHQRSEFSKHGPSPATSQSIATEAKKAQSISPRTNAQLDRAIPEVPPPQGMQESGRFEASGSPKTRSSPRAKNSSAYAPPIHQLAATASVKESMRHKARTRRHRQMQVVSGRATPITSNTTEARPPESSPTVSQGPEAPPRASPRQGTTPRDTIRHRRRMEAKTQASPPSQHPNNDGADWPTSSELAGAKM